MMKRITDVPKFDIDSNENAGHLHDRLMHLGKWDRYKYFRAIAEM
jgi:hypothetical protein